MWRVDGAAAQHYLFGRVDLDAASSVLINDAGGAAVLDDYALDQRTSFKAEIGAVQRGM